MVKIVCPNCKKDDQWEVYEVLNDPRSNYCIRCFNCHERFVQPEKKSVKAESGHLRSIS